MYQEKIEVEIAALPSNKASQLYKSTINGRMHLSGTALQRGGNWENVHLYLHSELPVGDGDYAYYNGEVFEYDSVVKTSLMRKVVASTDPDIQGLPLPSELLQEFVRANNAGQTIERASIMVVGIPKRSSADNDKMAIHVLNWMEECFKEGEKHGRLAANDPTYYHHNTLHKRFVDFVRNFNLNPDELD